MGGELDPLPVERDEDAPQAREQRERAEADASGPALHEQPHAVGQREERAADRAGPDEGARAGAQ